MRDIGGVSCTRCQGSPHPKPIQAPSPLSETPPEFWDTGGYFGIRGILWDTGGSKIDQMTASAAEIQHQNAF